VTNAVAYAADRTDAELAELARTGDTAAWGALVDRYSPYVHAIAVRAFGLQHREADDVFQEAFRRVYVGLRLYRGGDLREPVGRMARGLCLARTGVEIQPATAVALLEIEAAMDVHDALGALEQPGRDLLHRFFVRNEPYRTIAEALDVPVRKLPRQIARALDELCDVLAEESALSIGGER
jgi:RNA polymerase sigma factor (sigma-70 family)